MGATRWPAGAGGTGVGIEQLRFAVKRKLAAYGLEFEYVPR